MRLERRVPLLGSQTRFVGRRSEATGQGEQQEPSGRNSHSVAADELARAVGNGVGLGKNQVAAQEAMNVGIEGVDRGIALSRQFLQRLENDGVEVSL
jgi:hypothetical protein